MSWYDRLMPAKVGSKSKSAVPEGVWKQCDGCKLIIYQKELENNLNVCSKCGHHLRMGARERLASFLDATATEEIGADLQPRDPLKFKDSKRYKDRLAEVQKKLGESDALVVLRGELMGKPIIASAFEFGFIGGSMGAVVGERFVRGIEAALAERIPFVCFAASGGARMQEGLLSLLQMAKTAAAIGKLKQARLPYISVLTDLTYGGVSASLAMLGDVNIAEPKALIGFAGPRVIEQTVRETLPEGFQTAEFLFAHGALDMVVERAQLRGRIATILSLLAGR